MLGFAVQFTRREDAYVQLQLHKWTPKAEASKYTDSTKKREATTRNSKKEEEDRLVLHNPIPPAVG